MQAPAGRGIREREHAPIRRTDSRGAFRPDRTSQYIGLQIRTGRRLMGVSRAALAQELGIDGPQLGSFEQGQCEPPAVMMARIANILDKPLPWFSHRPATAEPTAARDDRPCVLLVDDSPDVLVILGAFMDSAGLRVIKVSSGDEALRVVASDESLHAIVTDNVMPGLSGADLLMQAAHLRPDVPGLIITGSAKDANGLSELPKTVSILSKPFRREELVLRIREITRPAPPAAVPIASTLELVRSAGPESHAG